MKSDNPGSGAGYESSGWTSAGAGANRTGGRWPGTSPNGAAKQWPGTSPNRAGMQWPGTSPNGAGKQWPGTRPNGACKQWPGTSPNRPEGPWSGDGFDGRTEQWTDSGGDPEKEQWMDVDTVPDDVQWAGEDVRSDERPWAGSRVSLKSKPRTGSTGNDRTEKQRTGISDRKEKQRTGISDRKEKQRTGISDRKKKQRMGSAVERKEKRRASRGGARQQEEWTDYGPGWDRESWTDDDAGWRSSLWTDGGSGRRERLFQSPQRTAGVGADAAVMAGKVSWYSKRRYTAAGALAHVGSRILEVEAVLLALLLMLLGGYSLWDMYRVSHNSYISEELLAYKPDPEADPQQQDGLSALAQINPDVRGWLTVPDTSIDYPLLQGRDDMDYLNRDVYGEYTLSGSIFLSAENASDLTGHYLMTYGHNMASGAMFSDVARFVDADYFGQHPEGSLTGFDQTFRIRFFAVVQADAYDDDYYGVTRLNEEEESWRRTISRIKSESMVSSGVSVTAQDQIIALSTCSETATNGRIILFGKLEPTLKDQRV